MADVFVAVPAYRGAELLPETLRSIRAQTYEDFRVVMSVDGDDPDTLAVCRDAAERDPRFEVVHQPERLGWPGNFNWLAERCDLPFFCYWQQDDLASTGYLQALHDAALAHPGAAIAFTDVQWFGAEIGRDTLASSGGPPLERVLDHLEHMDYLPLRGLIRAELLPDAPAIAQGPDGPATEFVLLAELAARGAFVRTGGALYFKRAHDAAASRLMTAEPGERRRREWIRIGAGILAVALRHAPPETHGRLLATVLDRLTIPRPGRRFFFEIEPSAQAVEDVAVELAIAAGIDLGDERWRPGAGSGLERPVHPLVSDALDEAGRRARDLAQDEPPLRARLGSGWHEPEDWGAWTSGEHATVELGDWPGGPVVLEGRVFAPGGSARVGWSVGSGEPVFAQLEHGPEGELETADVPAGTRRLHLHLPDATSPAEAGLSPDPRTLCFGLVAVRTPRSRG